MKHYVVNYSSEGNLFRGEMIVWAPTLRHAQDRFLDWVRIQPQYIHLWNLEFKFREVQNCILPPVADNDRTDNI